MAIVSIEDLRERARARLPRSIFDFVDGGAYDEVTLRANRADLEAIRFAPRALVDVSTRDLSVELLGRRQAMPLVLAPSGNAGMLARRGEVQAVRAADAAGVPMCLSTMSVCPLEDVQEAAGHPLWFQLYVLKDRGMTQLMVERAQAAGCAALVFTVDLPVMGQRDRDVRNGFTVPPRITLANALDMLRRAPWIADVLLGPKVTYGNLVRSRGQAAGQSGGHAGNGLVSLAQHVKNNTDDSLSWKDVEWARRLWKGPMLLKGILSPEDAKLAASAGMDGVIVSNHGGRQLDHGPSTISVLPRVVDAVGDRMDVLFDGGIRRGQDVVKAMALGARACLVGRAFLYGLAAGGEAGVTQALDILRREMDVTLALLGKRSFKELGADSLTLPH